MGNFQVYEILVREHADMLSTYVRGITGNQELAEEITQATFVRAYEKLDSLKHDQAFGAWIRVIARNLTFKELKRRGREKPTEPAVIQGMEDIFGGFDRGNAGETWQEKIQLVRGCFEELPEKLKSACQMHYFDDLKSREIAEQLGVGLAAILKRLERARDGIRSCVETKLALEELT